MFCAHRPMGPFISRVSLDPVALVCFFFFFFNDTATTEIYTFSLHDALPISRGAQPPFPALAFNGAATSGSVDTFVDRKSTRLNSSHLVISYAVFCLKKKKIQLPKHHPTGELYAQALNRSPPLIVPLTGAAKL